MNDKSMPLKFDNHLKTHLNHHQQKVQACCALCLRTKRKSDMEYRIFWPLATGTDLPSERKISPQPWFQVAKTSAALSPGIANYGLSFDSYSSISATLTVAGTGSCLLEEKREKSKLLFG